MSQFFLEYKTTLHWMRCLFLITKKGDDVIYLVRNWATLVLVQYIYISFSFLGELHFFGTALFGSETLK